MTAAGTSYTVPGGRILPRQPAEFLAAGVVFLARRATGVQRAPRDVCFAHAAPPSYRELFEELREELAKRHLREGKLAIGEVAFLLGFSEPSAFHRAFKRWTGTTAADYRAQPPT